MVARYAHFLRPKQWFTFFPLLILCATAVFCAESVIRYLSFSDAGDTLRLFADSGLAGSDIVDSTAWDLWIRKQDALVRARIDRGIEDSISNLILYGTSYTELPRLDSAEGAADGGGLTEGAREYVRLSRHWERRLPTNGFKWSWTF